MDSPHTARGAGAWAAARIAMYIHQTAPEKIVPLTGLLHVWFYFENKHLYHLKYSLRKHWSPRWTGLPYL